MAPGSIPPSQPEAETSPDKPGFALTPLVTRGEQHPRSLPGRHDTTIWAAMHRLQSLQKDRNIFDTQSCISGSCRLFRNKRFEHKIG